MNHQVFVRLCILLLFWLSVCWPTFGDEVICTDIESSLAQVETVDQDPNGDKLAIEIIVPASYGTLQLHHGSISLMRDDTIIVEADLAFTREEDSAGFYITMDSRLDVKFVATYIGACTSKLHVALAASTTN